MKFGINNPAWLQAAGNRARTAPFFFRSLEDDNSFSVKTSNTSMTSFVSNLSYQINGGDWMQLGLDSIILNNNDIICIKNTTGENKDTQSTSFAYFSLTKRYEVGGDMLPVFYPSGDIPAKALYGAFRNESTLVNASSLVIGVPSSASQYGYMFENCASLASAPVLPAEAMTDYCYSNMFKGCTSLTSAPELPATTLAIQCYYSMFEGCTSLASAPILPAEVLAEYCYSMMFSGCTSLTSAPELPATTLAKNCYFKMFENCASLASAPELPATTLAIQCYSNMFSGCTSLTSAPELPATTLENSCYLRMFNGCSNLSSIVCLGAPNGDATSRWVTNVAANGTFTKRSGVSWSTGEDGIPSGWTVIEQ